MYLSLSAFPVISEGIYGQVTTIANLSFLLLCAGFQDSLQISYLLIDDVSRTFLLNSDFSLFLNTTPESYLEVT